PDYRSIDGTGNNLLHTEWGSTEEGLVRVASPDNTRLTDTTLASAREISNAVSAQSGNTANDKGLSDMFWLWGQFLDHDLTHVDSEDGERADIAVPTGDPQFDPFGTGTVSLQFNRSNATTGADGQRLQANTLTAFLDGSNVYGSDEETAANLREFTGGKLKMSEAGMMPADDKGQYMAGDSRANENPGLTSMHTLWVREHNHIAVELATRHPDWNDETLFQETRSRVVAEMQAITYNEFLPNLLGENALGAYQGYDPNTNPDISAEFASAAYRFGHSMLSSTFLRLDDNGQVVPEGNLTLQDSFFRPDKVAETGVDAIFRGFASQTAQAADPMVIDDVRNLLFGPPGSGEGHDLVALNIQRGRDHAVGSYNDVREQLGLARITSFDDPIWQGDFGQKLAQVYDSPDQVDLWVGGMAEQHAGDALLGETLTTILTDQFQDLRSGDRFWYENRFSGQALEDLNSLRLSDVIKRNTEVVNIQDNVMIASNIHLQQVNTD
ncbi:MAG TPA: peroxidase family protein, partial [Thiolinea sp.]|nr:peroxidase family protein [Thiolinea sp.]